ncbi:peptidylprolyl isomerase [Candidatus Woesebacteria bacterium]|nr:peptidylprolyl isomerase [Candidatus Woesebacteria bacterium]
MNKEEKTLKDFKEIKATQAVIETDKGNITVELFRDKAPLTTANFVNLVSDKFYDGIVFHRVIPDFMAQVGDPLTKESSEKQLWGTGGPGYTIADEFDPSLKHDAAGVLSMANAGPNTGGSQFFITYEATPWLDGKHAVFGKVTSGMDVLKKITQGDTIKTITLK